MTTRLPLVRYNGRNVQMPAGDRLPAAAMPVNVGLTDQVNNWQPYQCILQWGAAGYAPIRFYVYGGKSYEVGVGGPDSGLPGIFYIFDNDNGAVRLSISAAGVVSVSHFLQLGADAPAVKLKRLTGTTASAQGSTVSVAHGLSGRSKILAMSLVIDDGSILRQEVGLDTPGYRAICYADDAYVYVKNGTSDSNNILSKAFRILLTYEE